MVALSPFFVTLETVPVLPSCLPAPISTRSPTIKTVDVCYKREREEKLKKLEKVALHFCF